MGIHRSLTTGLAAGAFAALATHGVAQSAPLSAAEAVVSCGGVSVVVDLVPNGKPVTDADAAAAATVLDGRIGNWVFFVPHVSVRSDQAVQLDFPLDSFDPAVMDVMSVQGDLTFHAVNARVDWPAGPLGDDSLVAMQDKQAPEMGWIVVADPVMPADIIADAQGGLDYTNRPGVNFRMTAEGARAFGEYTSAHIGEPIAIALDGVVMTAPVIQSPILGGSGVITGSFTEDEAETLAAILRSGALRHVLQVRSETNFPLPTDGGANCPLLQEN